jgi:hypothetical protein
MVARAGLTDRWLAVVKMQKGLPHIFEYPLYTLLRLYSLCVTDTDTLPLLTGLAVAAAAARESLPHLEACIVPIATAMATLLRGGGDAAEARRALMDLKGERAWSEVAGSEEQRCFLLESACECSVVAGRLAVNLNPS